MDADDLLNQGIEQYYKSQFREAFASWEQALALYRGMGDRQGEASSLGNLGLAYDSLGQYQRAIDFHEQHLTIAREIGDRKGEASSLGNLGNAYRSLGQYQRAIDFHEQYLTIAREIGDRKGNFPGKSGQCLRFIRAIPKSDRLPRAVFNHKKGNRRSPSRSNFPE